MPSKSSAGYHYPRPSPSFQSLYLLKPPFPSSPSNYADYYRRFSFMHQEISFLKNHLLKLNLIYRAKREVQPFMNINGTDETDPISIADRFVNNISPESNRTRRQIDDLTREELCQTRVSYINPQAALNVRTGNWMYIVNGGEMATQLVRTEICL
jgi:hypothetical protein